MLTDSMMKASWWTMSRKDPRFNIRGIGRAGFGICIGYRKAIKDKGEELGVTIPDDLEIGYHKD